MRAARALYGFLSREHWLIGASLVRVSLGAWALYFYLLHLPVRHALWGPSGLWPFDRFAATTVLPSAYGLSPSPLVFDAVYLAGIIVAGLFTLGWQPRLMSVAHWWLVTSLQERNFLITDGGDNLMRLVLLFLMLVNTGAYFSVGGSRHRMSSPGLLRPALAVAHNTGVLVIVVQLCLLYLSTGLYKTMGSVWQNGTALYYILRVQEFSQPHLAAFVYRNPGLVVLGTYGTVLFELMFPALLAQRWTRYMVAAAGVGFHAAIAVLMGLVTFSWSMLSVYPLLFTDGEYLAVTRRLRERLRLLVLFDGWCPFCTRSIGLLRRLDPFSLVEFVSFREPGIAEWYGIDPRKAEARIQSMGRSGRPAEGMDAMIQIALRTAVLWPALPLLLLGRLLFGQRLYDALAVRRFVLMPGGCVAHCAPARPRA